MKTKQTITSAVATALALKVQSELAELRDQREKQSKKKFTTLPQYKKLVKLSKARKAAADAYSKAERSFEAKYKVNVYGSGNRLDVTPERKSVPSVKELRSDILISVGISGIPLHKLVPYLLKKYNK